MGANSATPKSSIFGREMQLVNQIRIRGPLPAFRSRLVVEYPQLSGVVEEVQAPNLDPRHRQPGTRR